MPEATVTAVTVTGDRVVVSFSVVEQSGPASYSCSVLSTRMLALDPAGRRSELVEVMRAAREAALASQRLSAAAAGLVGQTLTL